MKTYWTGHLATLPGTRWTAAYMSAHGVATSLSVLYQAELGARQASKGSDVIRSRRGVVKMLIASVSVYVVSYSPAQIPLFYNLVSATPFRANWTFLVQPHTAPLPLLHCLHQMDVPCPAHDAVVHQLRRQSRPLQRLQPTSNPFDCD